MRTLNSSLRTVVFSVALLIATVASSANLRSPIIMVGEEEREAKQLALDITNLRKGDQGVVERMQGVAFLDVSRSDISYCNLAAGKEFKLIAKVAQDAVVMVAGASRNCQYVLMTQAEFVKYKRNFEAQKQREADQKTDTAKRLERFNAARAALTSAGR